MGKSSKKSTPKFEAAPAVAAPWSGKKGKREAEETLEKQVALKKQKKNGVAVQAIVKENVEAKTQKKKKKKEDETNSSYNDSSVSEDKPVPRKEQPAIANNGSVPAKQASGSDSSESSSEEDSYSDEEAPAQNKKPVTGETAKKEESSESSSDTDFPEDEAPDESSDDDKEIDKEGAPNKKDTDVEMVDTATPQKIAKQQDLKSGEKAPQTPATPQVQQTGSRTLFVGNLHFRVEQADIKEFFKDAGEIVEIRLSTDHEGNFKGYGHVEFATTEAAQKALELNGEYLISRSVRLDWAHERGAYTPHSGNGNNSFQKGGSGQARTIFVKGFDQSLGEEEIKKFLEEHFGSCGEISRVALPVDQETGAVKGFAYLDFNDGDSFNKALELNGSEVNNYSLSVEEAKPRGESRGGHGNRRGGGRSGGKGRGGRGGWHGGGRSGGAGRRR